MNSKSANRGYSSLFLTVMLSVSSVVFLYWLVQKSRLNLKAVRATVSKVNRKPIFQWAAKNTSCGESLRVVNCSRPSTPLFSRRNTNYVNLYTSLIPASGRDFGKLRVTAHCNATNDGFLLMATEKSGKQSWINSEASAICKTTPIIMDQADQYLMLLNRSDEYNWGLTYWGNGGWGEHLINITKKTGRRYRICKVAAVGGTSGAFQVESLRDPLTKEWTLRVYGPYCQTWGNWTCYNEAHFYCY